MEVVRFYIELGSEQHHIVDFDLFFTVANQEGFAQKAGLFVYYLRGHEVVLVGALLVSLGGLLLLVVGDIAAVRLCVFDLISLFVDTISICGSLALRPSSLSIRLVRLIRSWVLVGCVGATASQLTPLPFL